MTRTAYVAAFAWLGYRCFVGLGIVGAERSYKSGFEMHAVGR